MKSMEFYKVTALIILLILVAGCATVYFPAASPQVEIIDGYAVVKNDSILLAVTHSFWVKEPQELTDYFMAFQVTLKNRTDKKMQVEPQNISLLDEAGNQYDAVIPEEILDLLIPEEIMFEQYSPFDEERSEVYENWREAKNNLLTDSFNYGAILPQAQKSGYVFFPRLRSKNSSCQFVFNDIKIQFVREK